MSDGARVAVISLALNEHESIGKVLSAIREIFGTFSGVFNAGGKIVSTMFPAATGHEPARRRSGPPNRLIVFTRYPEPGKTKKRLISSLGPERAADLQRQMTEHIMGRVRGLVRLGGVVLEVRYDGATEDLMGQWLGMDLSYRPQGPGNVGKRMERAFAEAFAAGMKHVVIIGSDCPGITEEIIHKAFQSLESHDLVLGPAGDGGYYLIGLNMHFPPLFADIVWGTETVLEKTREIAAAHGLSLVLGQTLEDVDRPEDLRVWENESRGTNRYMQKISVIIPALNEAARIGATLASVRACDDVEIIVVDAGSEDRTAETARAFSATVLSAPRCRAAQMNAGAAQASGDILLFLHADTLLPEGWGQVVRDALSKPGTACGAFTFRLDAKGPWLRFIERMTNLRSRIFQMPYGDQALFLKADLFRMVGGFPDLPIMEDFELVRRLRQEGRIRLARAEAITSARRWRTLGVWRTTLMNQLMVVGYLMGVSPPFLARAYRGKIEEEPR